MTIKWRGILNIRWSIELIEEVKEYLKDETLPKRLETYHQQWKFKRLFSQFTLGSDNELYVIVDEEEDLPKYFLDDNGELLFDVNLPMKFKLIETQEEKEKIIINYYSNLLGNAYRSATNLHQRLMKEFVNISRKDVTNTLKNLELKQLIHPIEENKIVQTIVASKPMEHWQVDLIDMSSVSKQNDNVNFLMNVIDIFSKFAWSFPLKNKSSKSIAYSLQQIICIEGSPEIIQSDNGTEFINEDFIKLCQRFNIKHRTSLPYKSNTNGGIEKLNSTIKNYIFRYLTDHQSKRYIDNLNLMLYSYNSTTHSTTKKSPFEIHRKRYESFKMLDDIVHKNISDNAVKMIEQSLKEQQAMKDELIEGDKVRVGLLFLKEGRRKQKQVGKKNKQHWSNELYDVEEIIDNDGLLQYKINIPLKDEENRLFYRHQLLKIIPENLIKRKNIEDKFDYNFSHKFDSELHIKTLAKNTKEKELLEQPQNEIDEILETKEKDLEKDLEKNGKRSRKQTDKGFFVTF